MFAPILNESIIKRAQEKGILKINIHNLRDYTSDKHRRVDDRPFGGGSGMVLSPEPVFKAAEKIKLEDRNQKSPPQAGPCLSGRQAPTAENVGTGLAPVRNKLGARIILLSPQGKTLSQKIAKRLSKYKHIILICGHYEGVDERVNRYLADEIISIGDYVLTGGELAAMVLVDAVSRLVPGVLGDKNSLNFESFEGNLLEYPQYTRPSNFRGMKVPRVLLSGNHQKIEEWRKEQAVKKTRSRRPDLLSL